MSKFSMFLSPKRKENARFVLSDAYTDEAGKPAEWEMRELTAGEAIDIQKKMEGKSQAALTLAMVAESLVEPDLHDARLLAELSEREGRTILDPAEALCAMVGGGEFFRLCGIYAMHNSCDSFRIVTNQE